MSLHKLFADKNVAINSDLLRPIVDPLEDLPEGAFPDPLLLGEHHLGVDFLQVGSKKCWPNVDFSKLS